jgi:hypothetical protein
VRRWTLPPALASIVLLLLGGVVLASKDQLVTAVARPAPTVAAFTGTPRPVTPDPSTTAPAATIEPSPSPAPTAAPVVTEPPQAAVAIPAGDPATAVVSFYRLVTDRRYGDAAGLWSARMRSSYPPASNIDQRFADTRWIAADRAVTTFQGTDSATVSVYVTEVTTTGTRHWAGTWTIVRSGSTWLMDAPQLGPA